MTVASVADLLSVLKQHRLLSPAHWDELNQSVAPRYHDPRFLARDMVKRGWLTTFQVNELFQGRAHHLLLGSYVLLEKLGEGGMGTVYQARNRKLGQVVAVKLIRQERLDRPDMIKRFQREIRVAAKLDHPHIVRALDADEANGNHFLVMEYVEGLSLDRLIKDRGPLPVPEACEYIRQAALGLQHAFERGLVHRDIKPANILLADGGRCVKLLDMGMARFSDDARSEESSILTQEGAIMGTPDFMAPEQTLDSHLVDIRSDLYSLGCTLYFLLTGRVPFPGGSLGEKLMKHQMREPEPMEKGRPDVSPMVAGVVRKLMAKRPEDRYQTPDEVAAVLDTLLKDPTFRAQAPRIVPAANNPFDGLDWNGTTPTTLPSQPPRSKSWLRTLLLGGGGVALLVLGGLGLELPFLLSPGKPTQATSRQTTPEQETQWQAEREKEAAAALPALEQKAREPTANLVAFAQQIAAFKAKFGGTRSAVQATALLAGLRSPLDALDQTKIPNEVKEVWRGNGYTPPPELVGVVGVPSSRHNGPVRSVVHLSGGRLFASSGDDNKLRLWDAKTGQLVRVSDVKARYLAAARDKPLLAVTTESLTVYELRGEEIHKVSDVPNLSGVPGVVAMSPDGSRIAVALGDGVAIGLFTLTGPELKELATLKIGGEHLNALSFTAGGRLLVAGDRDKTVRVWNLATLPPKEPLVLKGHGDEVSSVATTDDARWLVSVGTHDHKLHLRELRGDDYELKKDIEIGATGCVVAFSRDGKMLALGRWEGDIRLSDFADGKLTQALGWQAHRDQVWLLSFSEDGRTLASGSEDGTVRLWDCETGKEVRSRERDCDYPLAFSDDATVLACGSKAEGSLSLWNLGEPVPQQRAVFKDHKAYSHGLAFSPDGKTLASTDDEGGTAVRLWDVATNQLRRTLEGHTESVINVAWRPDGQALATVGYDNTARIWDVASGKAVQTLQHPNLFKGIAFSPDGRRVATADAVGAIRLWDVGSGHEVRDFAANDFRGRYVTFHPDGGTLATIGFDGIVRAWDVVTGKDRGEYQGLGRATWFLSYSPDGRMLASSSEDGQIIVWEVSSGATLHKWAFGSAVMGAAFTPDGRHLAVAVDGTVIILRLASPSKP